MNGSVVSSPSFAATAGWGGWTEVSIPITLAAGHNSIALVYASAAGSTNYLNLDSLSIDLD